MIQRLPRSFAGSRMAWRSDTRFPTAALLTAIGYDRNGVRDDQLPEAYHHLRDSHPFHFDYVPPDKSRGPFKDIFFQRATAEPSGVASRFTAIESVGHYESRARTEGWLLEPPTGTDTLYWNIVRYGVYSYGSAWTGTDLVETGDIEWSIDHARTWLTIPPTDYSTVTHVRVLQDTEYLNIPVNADPDPDNPWVELAPHRDISVMPTNGVITFEVDGAGLRDLYQIGIRMDIYNTFDLLVISGEAWLSTNFAPDVGADPAYGLQLIPPMELEDTSIYPPPPYSYILSIDALTGDVRIDHTDLGILSSPYSGRAACYLTFAGFPVTTLNSSVDATTASIVVDSSIGMKEGDVLYVEDEQMRISSPVGGSTLDVTRGVNGTTAAAHLSRVTVRGTVTQDLLHLVHLWEVDNTIPARCRASVIGLKRAGR